MTCRSCGALTRPVTIEGTYSGKKLPTRVIIPELCPACARGQSERQVRNAGEPDILRWCRE